MIARLALVVVVLLSPLAAFAQQEYGRTVALLESLSSRPDLKPLKAVIVARDGRTVVEQGYRGHTTTESVNIKSASKSIISSLVGIAIEKKLLEGPDQPIAPILKADLPADPDPRLNQITIGNLLSMQAGLGRLSGPNY